MAETSIGILLKATSAVEWPCGQFTETTTGSNGSATYIVKDFPWQVDLFVASDISKRICKGVLVHRDWVLTSAPCLENVTSALKALIANSEMVKLSYQEITVEFELTVSSYSQTDVKEIINPILNANKFGLLRLANPSAARPVCLSPDNGSLGTEQLDLAGVEAFYDGRPAEILPEEECFANGVPLGPTQLCISVQDDEESLSPDSDGGIDNRGLRLHF